MINDYIQLENGLGIRISLGFRYNRERYTSLNSGRRSGDDSIFIQRQPLRKHRALCQLKGDFLCRVDM